MYKISWSEISKEDYWKNIDYLLEKFTEREAIHFITKVDDALALISQSPITYRKTEIINIHAFVVVPQMTIFYKIGSNKNVELIRFWNNYGDPNNLKF